MSHTDPSGAPPSSPEVLPPVMPGVGTVSPPPPGTDGPVEEDDHEIDPHPDIPDDFDEDAVPAPESVETVIKRD